MAFNQAEAIQNRLSKRAEAQKKSKVYTTKVIDQIIKDIETGYETDMEPFFMGRTQYRDAGITFDYTDEEYEELKKCSVDINYFVATYAKFLNDKGRTLVKLRDYQHDILHLFGDEHYDSSLGECVPNNRNIILLQSRQSAKCVSPMTCVKTVYGDIPMFEIWKNSHKLGFLDTIKYFIYKLIYNLETTENGSK